MRYAPRAILAGGLGFAASFVVACGGGSGLLSGDQSIALSGQADEINSAISSGNCSAAANAVAALNRDVQTLPVTVNPTLRRNLTQGASTIAELAVKDCRHQGTTARTTTTTPTTTTTTTPTTTTTTTPTTATTPTDTGTTSGTTGGAGIGGTTTGPSNGTSGGAGAGGATGNAGGNGNSGG